MTFISSATGGRVFGDKRHWMLLGEGAEENGNVKVNYKRGRRCRKKAREEIDYSIRLCSSTRWIKTVGVLHFCVGSETRKVVPLSVQHFSALAISRLNSALFSTSPVLSAALSLSLVQSPSLPANRADAACARNYNNATVKSYRLQHLRIAKKDGRENRCWWDDLQVVECWKSRLQSNEDS